MKHFTYHTIVIPVFAMFLLSGCYTQLQTVHTGNHGSDGGFFASGEEITERREEARQKRVEELPPGEEQSYVYGYGDGVVEGYDDGWTDAEAYYFVDYDTRRWYDSYAGESVHIHNYYGYSPRMWHTPFYGRSYAHFSFGIGYNYYDPFYGWHDPWAGHGWGYYPGYNYYRYPAYGGYYGSPYYGNTFVFVNYDHLRVQPKRTYAARTTGLRSSGLARDQRTRSSETVRTAGERSLQERQRAVRSEVRSTGRTGTVNRSSGTVNRSRSSSGTVNRSSGTVNRSSSSNGRSASTNRSRGSR